MSSTPRGVYHILVSDPRILVRVLTPLLIAALLVGALLEYRRTTRDLERQFGEKQVFLARKAADHLSEVFQQVYKLMRLLDQLELEEGGPGSGGTHDEAHAMSIMDAVLDKLRDHGAFAAGILDGSGAEVLVTPESRGKLVGLVGPHPGPCRRAAEMCVRGPVSWKQTPSGWAIVVTILAAHQGEAGLSKIVLVLDWGTLQEQIARITRVSADTYAWVLDHQGRLIMHPEHREQLGHGAMEPEKSCDRCHSSYEVQRQMTLGRQGIGQIQVENREPKLVAFTPFQVGVVRWSLAVATPLRLATSGSRRSLLSISLFTGAIMLVMVIGAVLLDRESSRRIRSAATFNRELEQKVEQRTSEIKALYERLAVIQGQHARLERTAVAGEMAAIVAHEVRTPLNVLSINAQRVGRLLRQGGPALDKLPEVVTTLEQEIQRINALLEEHLLAQVRQRPLELEPHDLNDLVMDSIHFMEPEADRQGVELVPGLATDLPSVVADAAKLRQVLLNILLNAIQALRTGGRVDVTTRCSAGQAEIRIQDDGPGIADSLESDPDRIFRPFVTTKEDGTGLGLAICSRLVRAMGGTISVRSKRGEGACFTILLPVESGES